MKGFCLITGTLQHVRRQVEIFRERKRSERRGWKMGEGGRETGERRERKRERERERMEGGGAKRGEEGGGV